MIQGQAMEALERRIGRLLVAITYVAVTLLVIGVLLMIANGISPLAGGPPLDVRVLVPDLLALDPSAFLWLGLLAVIATPISRVVVAGWGYARAGDRRLLVVSAVILLIIVVGVVTAIASEA